MRFTRLGWLPVIAAGVLQELAAPTDSGALAIVDPKSLEWNEALQAAGAVCGDDFGTYGWVGG